MDITFIKMDYRFTYFDGSNEKHIFDFFQYTDGAAVRTIDELFRDTEVTPIALYNIANGAFVFDDNSKFCRECAFV